MISMDYIEALQTLREDYYAKADGAIARHDDEEAQQYLSMSRAISEAITRLLNYDMDRLTIARMEADLKS